MVMVSCIDVKEHQNSQNTEVLEWNELIDTELSKWDNFLSYQHQVGYDGSQPKDEQGNLIPPVGLNNPNYDVFTTFQEGDETIIRNTGEYYGCLITKQEYQY